MTPASGTAEQAETPAATVPADDPPPRPPGRAASRLWPRSEGAAPWPASAAAVAAAVVSALTGPFDAVGVAGVITGTAVVAVPAAVVATSGAARRRLLRPLPLLAMAAALTLLGVGTFRAAAWLYALCVVAAVWLISYALAAGRRWPSVLLGGAAAWAGIVRGRAWLADGIGTAVRSTRAGLASSHPQAAPPGAGDAAAEAVTAGDDATPRRLGPAGVALLTALVIVVFGSLLASADDEFARVLSGLVSAPSPDLGGRIVAGVAVAAFALGAAYVARTPPRLDKVAASRPRVVRAVDWAIPAGALVLLFALFTVVQSTRLFGGESHLNLTSGLTYATYARSGFAELIVVTVLTLGVLAAVARWAPRSTPSQRTLVRVLAGAICVFTLVIVASAVHRMDLYQQAYGLTRLRLVVTAFEVWLGVVFVLVLIAGIRMRAAWLPRAVVGTAVVALLGLAALDPDAYIAERNVERFEATGRIDVGYLNGLSADAAPVLTGLPEPERSCALRSLSRDLADDDPWAAFNVSRESARSILDDQPVDEIQLCRAVTEP